MSKLWCEGICFPTFILVTHFHILLFKVQEKDLHKSNKLLKNNKKKGRLKSSIEFKIHLFSCFKNILKKNRIFFEVK
jgi:hypothetical protein